MGLPMSLKRWIFRNVLGISPGVPMLDRYADSANQSRNPLESRAAFIARVTRPHMRRVGLRAGKGAA